MAKYYGMMVQGAKGEPWTYEFGSFTRQDVVYECEDYRDHGMRTKLVVFAECPTQTEIEYFIREFNAQV